MKEFCANKKTSAPSPSPFPLFSPWAGQLLSSLPMGEKRGKGEGDGAVLWLPTQWAAQTAVSESKNLCSIQALFCQKSLFVRKPSHNIWLVVCGCVCKGSVSLSICLSLSLSVSLCLSLSLSVSLSLRQRQTDRDRQTETDRYRQKQTETDRETERQRDKQTHTETAAPQEQSPMNTQNQTSHTMRQTQTHHVCFAIG